jgi:uncharacterized iron-regulated protein
VRGIKVGVKMYIKSYELHGDRVNDTYEDSQGHCLGGVKRTFLHGRHGDRTVKMKYSSLGCVPLALLLIQYFVMAGCSMIKPAMPPLASIEGISRHFRVGQIIDIDSGSAISFDQLIDRLESKTVIFIGEVHDNPEHHLIQVQILQALMDRYAPLAVAMEFFQKHKQEALERYMHGTTTEELFLKDVEWNEGWTFDYHLYRPLILMIRAKGGEILAINAPNKIVKKVARSGISSLEPEERRQLAKKIDLGNKGHRAYLSEVYKEHVHPDLKRFDYFYQAQCVWEDTMAENIAEYLTQHQEKMVVFAGNGHLIKKFGVPDRTQRRIPGTMATILPYPLTGHVMLKRQDADYIWLTRDYPKRHPKSVHGHGRSIPIYADEKVWKKF